MLFLRRVHLATTSRSKAQCHIVALILLWRCSSLAAIPDFSFLQVSDIHTPMVQSAGTIGRIRTVGDIDLPLFQLKAPKPEFVVATGDLTEFGGGNGWWEEYLSYWKECPLPIYNQLGNHDNTWRANIKSLRDTGFAPCYSFDRNGCHFVGLMTATPQDPRPSIPEEQIVWLRRDLEKVALKTPVFVFFHHPLGGSEFASRYDYDRLLDVLRSRNTVMLMAGHSHGHVYRPVQGMDQVTGGSTFGLTAGFAVYTIKDGKLFGAYWRNGTAAPDTKLIEKEIPTEVPYPALELVSPKPRSSADGFLAVKARFSTTAQVDKALVTIDDREHATLDLTQQEDAWVASGTLDLKDLIPGAHYLRVEFVQAEQRHARSTQFFHDPDGAPIKWRAYLGASSKATPAMGKGVVYVGSNDGELRAFDTRCGAELWSVSTGAEILTEPLVHKNTVIIGNGLGLVSAYNRAGKQIWKFTAGDAVYSSPVLAKGRVVFGCNDGTLHALNADNGKELWQNGDASYSIESKPCFWRGKIFFGAWDQNIRCVDAATGKLLWKRVSEGVRSAKVAHRYYSPADAGPVIVGVKVMIADRNYMLTVLDAISGEQLFAREKVVAVSASGDGRHAYLRKTDGTVSKVDENGKELWSFTANEPGAIPASPVEKNGVLFSTTARGKLSALAAETGTLLWQYQASPELFVMSSPASDGTSVYVTSFDGTLTAIKTAPKR